MTNTNKKFYTEIIGDNLLFMKLSNIDTPKDIDDLQKWSDELYEKASFMFDKFKTRNKSLVDISDIKKLHPKQVKIITDIIKRTDEFTGKVATYGGNSFIVMAQDAIVGLSKTKQEFKAFHNKEEAEKWLLAE